MTRTLLSDDEKAAQERAEFQRRLATAMEAMSTAAALVHEARMLSPTSLELDLLRSVAARAADLVSDLHTVATSEELQR